jgi:HSP20 family molecular chaperone IbpA
LPDPDNRLVHIASDCPLRVSAFRRTFERQVCIVVAPLDARQKAVDYAGKAIGIGTETPISRWRDVLTGGTITATDTFVDLAFVFSTLPVALLVPEPGTTSEKRLPYRFRCIVCPSAIAYKQKGELVFRKSDNMASQTATAKSKDTSSPISVQKECQHLKDRANNAVARRAYALYLSEGAREGDHLNHWLRAESEVLTRVSEIRESSSWYIVNVPLPDFEPEQIQVGVDQTGVIVTADKTPTTGEPGADGDTFRESLILVATWPSSVDPSTASAYIKGGGLTLTAKRAEGGSLQK